MTLTVVIFCAIIVSAVTGYLLYKTTFLKKEFDIHIPDVKKTVIDGSHIPSLIRDKVKNLPIKTDNPEVTVEAISKIVDEQTRAMLQEMKQEYEVKYQIVSQQKNKEVEVVKKEYKEVKDKYETAQKKYKKAETDKKQTEAVVKGIAEGLVIVNQKGEILLMNSSAERLLGTDKNKKIGKSILDDIPPELMVSLSRPAGDTGDRVIEYVAKDENVKKVLRSSSAVIQNEEGETVGMLNILTDVTKQKELDEIKNKFISNVTHELRTPIVAMQKAISILLGTQAGALSDTQSNFLSIVSRNLGHLSRLVEDLLDIAKIDSGKMRIKFLPSDLAKVILDVCDSVDAWAKSKKITITREVEKDIPEFPFDPGRITQVMNNLLSNAIKFTPVGGRITIRGGWHPDGKRIEVSVTDTGVGITKEDQEKLFGRFQQFGSQQGISGTGLGLSIVKEILERHSGEISVKSEEGKGATFIFTLPIKPIQIGV